MLVTETGITTDTRLVQSEQKLLLTLVTESAMTIDTRLVQPEKA